MSAEATLLLDTRRWVALHRRVDNHHTWATQQFSRFAGPFVTCEAVVAEACFLLARGGHDPAKALALMARGAVRIGMSLGDEIDSVQALLQGHFERYDNVPASLADACLVRLSELYERCRVVTLDSDFNIYRRHGRKVIPFCGRVENFAAR